MSDPAREPLLRHAPAVVHGRYLVRAPEPTPPAGAPWLVGFHGYAQTAESMLEPLAAIAPGPHWLVASVQALHPFQAGRARSVVASWMTRQDRELAIADNIAYLDTVIAQIAGEFGAPRVLAFAGFSQGVAMAYRAARRGRREGDAIVAVGGDVPPELRVPEARPWPRVLMATGERDAFHPPAKLTEEAEALRALGARVEALVFEGGHEWPEAMRAPARALLAETAAGAR